MSGSAPGDAVPEKVHTQLQRALDRTVALQHAAGLVGQAELARGMNVAVRTLKAYLAADRRLPAVTLQGAAGALERRAIELIQHADKLRELAR